MREASRHRSHITRYQVQFEQRAKCNYSSWHVQICRHQAAEFEQGAAKCSCRQCGRLGGFQTACRRPDAHTYVVPSYCRGSLARPHLSSTSRQQLAMLSNRQTMAMSRPHTHIVFTKIRIVLPTIRPFTTHCSMDRWPELYKHPTATRKPTGSWPMATRPCRAPTAWTSSSIDIARPPACRPRAVSSPGSTIMRRAALAGGGASPRDGAGRKYIYLPGSRW